MKLIISYFLTQLPQEVYEKEINVFKEHPDEAIVIIIYSIMAVAITIALIYLYILIIKYLRLKIKAMKKIQD
ncbi:hypothetical protein [Paucihalobacter sp.]|uniref:hypothetical protein n=1 Tax=Paucihalobacter sp. TaxID=2850405 RepID=UPI002FE08361